MSQGATRKQDGARGTYLGLTKPELINVEESLTKKCDLTFEEDELALAVLVHGVYLRRQAPPENADEHGVPRHHRVISHSPKPVVLEEKQRMHET